MCVGVLLKRRTHLIKYYRRGEKIGIIGWKCIKNLWRKAGG